MFEGLWIGLLRPAWSCDEFNMWLLVDTSGSKVFWQHLGRAFPMVSIPPVESMTESEPMPQLCINVHAMHAIPTFSLRPEDDSSSSLPGGVQFSAAAVQC